MYMTEAEHLWKSIIYFPSSERDLRIWSVLNFKGFEGTAQENFPEKNETHAASFLR